ncbi:MAG TPA: GH116 family glycosyl hydrolase [Blastocatellia bacterium]|nr:GH116 family glycosyl hydrolase [Blastocatellia bacterium]
MACSLVLFFLCGGSAGQRVHLRVDLTADGSFLEVTGLELTRPIRRGAVWSAIGRRAAIIGSEDGRSEAWVYPLQLVSDLRLSFRFALPPVGNEIPPEIPAQDVATRITVRPEATTLTYVHGAFTVRQIVFVPLTRPGAIMLLDVDAHVPLKISVHFEPTFRLMWPAEPGRVTVLADHAINAFLLLPDAGAERETKERGAGIIGSPAAALEIENAPPAGDRTDPAAAARMPQYRLVIDTAKLPIARVPLLRGERRVAVVALGAVLPGTVDAARSLYHELITSIDPLYRETVENYRRLARERLSIQVPDERLVNAFEWAKTALDKAFAENPLLGAGLVAGFGLAGESGRPGFAWYFGRDSLWTQLALNSSGDFEKVRESLRLLKKYQRSDGKIMHELSHAAPFVEWFSRFPYPYASADSTPLYIIALEDYYRTSGDLAFLQEMWESARRAYAFARSTDRDGNGLIENTDVGHGWVEGGALHPVHEEIYLAGLWVQASRAMARMAAAMGDKELEQLGHEQAEKARRQIETLYWLNEEGYYAFARQRDGRLVEEKTVMPAVPMIWRLLEDERARRTLEALAASDMTTDWGVRLLSRESEKYNPISYHHGSVWPLFTGWAALASYRYHKAPAAAAALMANVLLTESGSLGWVTEVLSGDRFSSIGVPQQIWSSAMVILPLVRGLFGLEGDAPASLLRCEPQLPPEWDQASVRNVRVGHTLVDIEFKRSLDRVGPHPGIARMMVTITQRRLPSTSATPLTVELAPSFPLDATIHSVTVNGRPAAFEMIRGAEDQICRLTVPPLGRAIVDIRYRQGTSLSLSPVEPREGDRPRGLKLLRVEYGETAVSALVEGVAGETYLLDLFTPREIAGTTDVEIIGREPSAAWGMRYRLRVRLRPSIHESVVRQKLSVTFAP